MNIFEKLINSLRFEMTTPTNYSWFHILSLIIMILLIIFLIKKYKNAETKKIQKLIFVCATISIIFEIYKQIDFSFNYDGIKTWWEYQWYAFPYQFCSTPMYVGFIAYLVKNEKIKKALYAFLGTYGLIGGIIVMLYPNTVFVSQISINIQTMVHHGLMVVMGSLVIFTKQMEFNFKTLISAMKVFIVLIIIALTIDISTYYLGIDNGLEMFFISPFHPSSLPVFNIIYEKVPYIVFLIIYIFGFTLGASLPIVLKKIKK